MRILESAPHRYDRGMRLLTLGGVERAYDRLVCHLQPGQRVLDIGCGTGALAVRAARRGARVKGIDTNPEMLALAAERLRREGLQQRVELAERGVAELDAEPGESYDVVMSGLCFSELSADERRFALSQSRRLLVPGGRLLLADESVPRSWPRRLAHAALRAPLALLTWLLTQQTSHAVAHLEEEVRKAGFRLASLRTSFLDSFVEIVACKPDGESP